ncbi:MAG TPA: hypothetical protein VGQ83_19710 [Polyangia bacterium]|jgi:hypothetical protein
MPYRFSRGKFNATNNDFGNTLTMGRWQWPGHHSPGTQVPALGLATGVDGTLASFVAYTNALCVNDYIAAYALDGQTWIARFSLPSP